MLETLIRDKLVKHIKDDLFRDTQPGFHNKCFYAKDMLDSLNDYFNEYDKSKAINIISLDFQKALQCPPPAANIHTTSTRNSRQQSDMDRKLASNRKQRIAINGKSSSKGSVLCQFYFKFI